MGYRYVKLFEQILESTIWCEPAATRLVWITMLCMADRDGVVLASVPGLAGRAKVTIPETVVALERFQQPDQFSRTKGPVDEGRRIEEIDGGWRLINHSKYRDLMAVEAEKERKRQWWRDNKGKQASLDAETSETSGNSTKLASSEVEAVNQTPSFDLFWQTWPDSPRKVAKAKCAEKWARLRLDQMLADGIIEHVVAMKSSKQWKDGYEPAPLTYLNQRRWEDGVQLPPSRLVI